MYYCETAFFYILCASNLEDFYTIENSKKISYYAKTRTLPQGQGSCLLKSVEITLYYLLLIAA